MTSEVKVGFYPYSFVRTNVMRSKLLKSKDYQRLMKMSVSEITKYLQEIHYREDINALGGAYSTAELIELALNRNLDRSFRKLRSICSNSETLLVFIDKYLHRYDVWNAKTVLRAVQTDRDEEDAEKLLSDAGIHPREYYAEALRSDSKEEALKKLSEVDLVTPDLQDLELAQLENELERRYYQSLLEFADRIPKQVNLFKKFITKEIEITNILTIVRLMREGLSKERIKPLMILPEDKLSRSLSEKLLEANDLDGVLERLQDSKYGDILEEPIQKFQDTGSLTAMERNLKKHLLEESVLFLHQDMLSPNVILGYMFAKEIEVKNLRTIIKGKKFGVDEEMIEEELVT